MQRIFLENLPDITGLPHSYTEEHEPSTADDDDDRLIRDAVAYTPGGTGVCTVDHTFPAGVGTGAITEVGLFDDPAAGNMFNRKTFPAINKTAGDALKASCTLTLVAA